MTTGDLQSLYQQLILDHSRSPHAKGVLAEPTASSHQVNPTCGDEVTLTVDIRDDRVAAIGWDGHGCSISQASASLLATLIDGKELEDVGRYIEEFRTAMRSRGEIELDEERFGDAIAPNGVSRYIARVKCAMLPWVALEDALSH